MGTGTLIGVESDREYGESEDLGMEEKVRRDRSAKLASPWKILLTMIGVLLLAVCLLSAGCSGNRKAREEDGKETDLQKASPRAEAPGVDAEEPESVDDAEDQGAVNYRTDGGEVTYQVNRDAPPEEMLGVPVYPGASYVPQSGGSVSGTSPEGEFFTTGGEYRTIDSFDAVYEWYRERLGDPVMYNRDQLIATWNRAEEDRRIVIGLRGEGGVITILIYSVRGNAELFSP